MALEQRIVRLLLLATFHLGAEPWLQAGAQQAHATLKRWLPAETPL
jgi:hypothetical protein